MSDVDEGTDADRAAIEGTPVPSARVALSRERVVSAAVDYVEREGLAGLSMRRLGTVLGVEAMSLYRYVQGREVLLDGIAAAVIATMESDEDVVYAPTHGWQDYLQRLAHGIRRVALSYPKCFPLVASRPTEAPWLRPPLRSVDWVERFLTGMIGEGFSDDAAVEAYRAFTGFLLGHLLLEVSSLGADLGPLDVLEEPQDGDERGHPVVYRLQHQLREDHSAAEFDAALEHLLDRLALIRSEQ